MRRVYLRIAAGVILASIVAWAAVAGLVPLLVGRFEERGFRAPMMTGGVWLLAASLEEAPREQWPTRLAAARAELGVALAIVRADSLASGVTNRLAAGAPAVVPAGRGRPSIYMPLGSGVDVLVAGPLPPLPLEPLLTTALVFAFVLTFTVSAAVGIPLMRRLRRLRHAISELGSGNLAIRLDPNEGELSELAESINRMASQLQRQFQEREALLQAVSHEMGTPLSRMRFAIEFLEEPASEGETLKRMRGLTADLDELDRLSSELVAWIETDGPGPHRRVFDVAPVLASLVELECQGSASAARVDLWAAPDLAIHADQRQFQRAIENLLRNALRYAQSRVVVEAEGDGERAVVEVRDDGPGIAAEDRRRVLDPFVRLETSRSGAQRGLGLGLAIVRRIVEAHGGSVVVDEAPEGGTQVRTVWPRGASANRAAHAGQPDRSIDNGEA